jgi:hypothetical protein
VRAKWRPRTHRAKEPAPCDLFPRRRIATIPRYPLPPASSSRVFLPRLPPQPPNPDLSPARTQPNTSPSPRPLPPPRRHVPPRQRGAIRPPASPHPPSPKRHSPIHAQRSAVGAERA